MRTSSSFLLVSLLGAALYPQWSSALNVGATIALSPRHHHNNNDGGSANAVGADGQPRGANRCNGKTLTDGKQIKEGSCSDTVQGEIPSVDNMVSSMLVKPDNGATIAKGETFKVTVAITGMETGFFDDAQKQYYLTPQTLNAQGQIQGHNHITIQKLDKNGPPNPQKFAFFKGLNDKSADGKTLSVDVKGGLNETGLHRICCMAGTRGHQPLLMPVAQRGAQDDCIRINVVEARGKKRKHERKKRPELE